VQDSQVPTRLPAVWANGAVAPYILSGGIPTASQQSVLSGAASLYDGFPPACFVPIATGGAGPFGRDFNTILNQITGGVQWQQAGGPLPHDATFSTAVGGYPLGALIPSDSAPGQFWYSTVDNNTSDPDTGGANWKSYAMLLGGTGNAQIIQVGNAPTINCSAGYGQTPVTFPVAFPHACLQVVASDDGVFQGVVGGAVVYACSSITPAGFELTAATPAQPTGTASVGARYIAVGW
jgi:hypothetical protein